MNFELALTLLKKGAIISRAGWKNPNIIVRAQYPTSTSMNTEPYLVMEKMVKAKNIDGTDGEAKKIFPLDLSCESIFAEDWYIKESAITTGKTNNEETTKTE